jgi:hypothetical protein
MKFRFTSYNKETDKHEIADPLTLEYTKQKLTTLELKNALTVFFNLHQEELNGGSNSAVVVTRTDFHNYDYSLWHSFDSTVGFLDCRIKEGMDWLGQNGLLEENNDILDNH